MRKSADEHTNPIEEFLVDYKEATQLEIQEISLEEGLPQDIPNKNFCKHTKAAQKFLVTPTKGKEYIHGIASKINFCVDNYQYPLIVNSGAHCSIVATEYLERNFPNWEKQLFPTKGKNLKCASGKMTSIGTIIKEIIILHREENIRLKPKLLVEDSHIQVFLLGTDYQRIYRIEI
ncbi:hypothetical protein O181_024992 [Austropuccinia psidii MF-1]|uniref:Uncharacterized protein n=1 Tax=Austropuccinia psidii MF-1 TaxID=1389203 RepID=A0A9Q3GZG3_9BASI|nr:hypothetical protein [Austropuccinia psidii MF-1]